MKKNTIFAARSIVLLAGLVLLMTPTALAFTHVTNVTNTVGLGVLVLLIWLAISTAAGLLCRHKLPLPFLLSTICLAWFLSERAYTYIGYYYFGWRGLMKAAT